MAGDRVLILGGTVEAVESANLLHQIKEMDIIYSLAGITRSPNLPFGRLQLGGFGGIDGLVDYLCEQKIALLIDATHPFSIQMKKHAAEAGKLAKVPILHLLRTAWKKQKGDVWHDVSNISKAAIWLQQSNLKNKAVIFLTIGSREIPNFFSVQRFRYLVRSIERPKNVDALEDVKILLNRGPFTENEEYELMRDNGVACLVTKNSGGPNGLGKIDAARKLGLPVVMVRRPKPPRTNVVTSVQELVLEAQRRLALG